MLIEHHRSCTTRAPGRRRRLAAGALLLALHAPALRAAPPGVDEATPAASARDLSALEERVRELEAELARRRRDPAPAATPATAELERRIEALTRELERLRIGEEPAEATAGRHGLGPAASKVYGVRRGVSIGGYGELLLQAPSDERQDGEPSGRRSEVDFLRAVLYTGYKFSDSLLFNSEIEFEHGSTGEGGEVSVEFAYLDFMWREEVNLRAGLLLVPMGFVNELHEPPTYLGARRPAVETRILPTTWRENGVGLFGDAGRLSWRAYLVNGFDASGFTAAGLRGGRQDGARALVEDVAFVGRLDWKPTLDTLVGGSLYTGDSSHTDGFGARTTIVELHGEVRRSGFEARALFARATVDDVAELDARLELDGPASIGSRLQGGYLQVGYDVLSRTTRSDLSLVPYLRIESLDTQAEVPAGFARDPRNDERTVTLGVAYRPHPQVVVKADWQDVSNEADTGVDQLNVQLGYIF